MKRIVVLLVAVFWGWLGAPPLLAQSAGKLEQVKALYLRGKYELALQLIDNARLARTDKEARFLQALCQYHLHRLDPALATLSDMAKNDRAPYPEVWFYMGKIFHARLQFEEAAQHYKTYLRSLRPENPTRPMLIEEIRRCDNGLRHQFRQSEVVVENLGPSVNSAADEFAPVLSPNLASRLYFSSARPGNTGGPRDENGNPDEQLGDFYSDMFTCQIDGGRWTAVAPLHYLFNSAQHETLLDFSADGSVLIYQQGQRLGEGAIFADTFQRSDQRQLRTTPLQGVLDVNMGDQCPFFYYDTLVIFASRRPGGFGGLDLYKVSRRGNGWTAPQNLGPAINSAFDETTPFLARDGRTLYYSTNNSALSMGGLDVVRTVYLPEAERWSDAENLGIPVNSAGDDAHFRLARDGFTGFLSSSRKDGYGKRDLYVAYFARYRNEMEPPMVVEIAPPPGSGSLRPPATPAPVQETYVLAIADDQPLNVGGFIPQLEQVRDLLSRYETLRLVISVYHPQEGAIRTGLFPGIRQAQQLADYFRGQGIAAERISTRSLTLAGGPARFAELTFANIAATPPTAKLPVVGGFQTETARSQRYNRELLYKVQIVSVKAAYQNDALRRFDAPMVESAPGGFFRYTLGACLTFGEAAALRRQLEGQGFKGCYVAPFVQGERIDAAQARVLAPAYPDLNNFLNSR